MDSVVVIAGANGGLGSNVLRHLLSSGVRNVACHYRGNRDRIDAILGEFDLDPDEHAFQAELTDEEAVSAMAAAIEARRGPVGVLLNFAGGSSNGMVWKLDKAEFQRIMDMNVTSTFLTCKAFIPGMRERRFGRIVNVSSVVGSKGAPGASHYAAAKAAVDGLTKSMSLELVRRGITVNALALGYFDAGIISTIPEPVKEAIIGTIPVGRLGESENEIGGLIRFLISPEAAYITGQTLHVNGGLH